MSPELTTKMAGLLVYALRDYETHRADALKEVMDLMAAVYLIGAKDLLNNPLIQGTARGPS